MSDPTGWVHLLYASCIGGGLVVGSAVAIFNSWRV